MRSAASWAGVRDGGVDVLPDQPVEWRPGLDALRQVADGQRDDDRRQPVLVREQVQLPDQAGRVLGHQAHDELALVVERDRDLRLGDDLACR